MLKTYLKLIPGLLPIARSLGLANRPGETRQFLLEVLPKGSVGAEVGVYVGDFSNRILEVVAPRLLYLIDPWEHQEGKEYEMAWSGGAVGGGQAVRENVGVL